jgi:hypothetical protein
MQSIPAVTRQSCGIWTVRRRVASACSWEERKRKMERRATYIFTLDTILGAWVAGHSCIAGVFTLVRDVGGNLWNTVDTGKSDGGAFHVVFWGSHYDCRLLSVPAVFGMADEKECSSIWRFTKKMTVIRKRKKVGKWWKKRGRREAEKKVNANT